MSKIKINFTKYIKVDATSAIKKEITTSLRKYIYLISRILNAFPNIQYIATTPKIRKIPFVSFVHS